MSGLLYPRKKTALHRATGALCATSLAVATLAIPLPLPQAKDLSEPYPCMNCGCGCANAEMCWRECCCYTHAEKLAWARKNGVTPPSYVLALVERDSREQHAVCHDGCCEKKGRADEELAHLPPCCRARALAQRKQTCTTKVCQSNETCCAQHQPAAKKRPAPGMLVLQALKCRGLTVSISLLPPCIPDSTAMSPVGLDAAVEQISLFDQFCTGVSPTPDVPPPRLYA